MSKTEMDPFDAEIMGAVDATVAACRAEIATLRARVAELEGPGYDFGACVLQVREIDRLRAEISTLRQRVAEVERERDEARAAIEASCELADFLNEASLNGAGFSKHWGGRVLQAVEPLRNVNRFRDQTLERNRVLLHANSEFLNERDAALARVGVLEAALRHTYDRVAVAPVERDVCEYLLEFATAALSSPPPHATGCEACNGTGNVNQAWPNGGYIGVCSACKGTGSSPPPHDGEGK